MIEELDSEERYRSSLTKTQYLLTKMAEKARNEILAQPCMTNDVKITLKGLPAAMKRTLMEAFGLFAINPYHRSLQYKRVHPEEPIYSIRVCRDFRALGLLHNCVVIWFWIGSLSDYDEFLNEE